VEWEADYGPGDDPGAGWSAILKNVKNKANGKMDEMGG
jgi:hypothetical protein